MSSDSQNSQQQLDPSIYQYDEVYDQIKGNKTSDKGQKSIEPSKNISNLRQQRQRSRQKQPQQRQSGGSKYIKKMREVVSERQKAHEYAHEKKLQRENQRLGIKPEEVFVTESYLKKKREQKERENKEKEKEKYDEEHSILNKKKHAHDFTRKLLEQRERKY